MKTDQTIANNAEAQAINSLHAAFSKVFSKVVVLSNLIFPTQPGTAVESVEYDSIVVCNAGVFIFEVKGWHNCKVLREKHDGEAVWSLLCPSGYKKSVRDPLQQIGGKARVVAPIIHEALLNHLAMHVSEAAKTLDVLSTQKLGNQVKESVKKITNRAEVDGHAVRIRSYVFLPLDGVEIDMNIPPQVISGEELPLMVRQLIHEFKRSETHAPFTDAMVECVANALHAEGSLISADQHLANIKAVHGDSRANSQPAEGV